MEDPINSSFNEVKLALEKELNKSHMVVKAHQDLLRELVNLNLVSEADPDPEMAQSVMDRMLMKFFDAVGYSDISRLMQLIDTRYH